jgi:hypothetical protein
MQKEALNRVDAVRSAKRMCECDEESTSAGMQQGI